MKIYGNLLVCSICGEEGFGKMSVIWADSVAHKDPNVCRENLARKAQELKERERKLNELENKNI